MDIVGGVGADVVVNLAVHVRLVADGRTGSRSAERVAGEEAADVNLASAVAC